MPVSRYEASTVVFDPKKNTIRLGLFPPILKEDLENDSDIIIQVQDGDRIDSLAQRYLGDGRYWWAICIMNDINLPMGDFLLPGKKLRIPSSLDKIHQFIEYKYTRK